MGDKDGDVEAVDSSAAPRRRRGRLILLVVVGVVALATAVWFLFLRVEYHVWRVYEEGHSPSSAALARMGPSVVPRICDEIAACGTADVGRARETFVSILQDIRHDVVAEQIGSPIIWEVRAALVPPDERMATAFRDAFRNEPLADARNTMLTWTSELDFEMAVRFFCDVFPDAKTPADRSGLLMQLPTHILVSERERGERYYPWRDLTDEQIAAAKKTMVARLTACAAPRIIATLREVASEPVPDDAAFLSESWRRMAVEPLADLAPLDPGVAAAIRRLVPDMRDWLTALALIDAIVPPSPDGAATLTDIVRETQYPEPRKAALYWLHERDRATKAAFACAAFPELDAQERLSLLFDIGGFQRDGGPEWATPTCLADVLLDAIAATAPTLGLRDASPSWLLRSIALLDRWTGWDVERRARVAALIERVDNPYTKKELAPLLPADTPKPEAPAPVPAP